MLGSGGVLLDLSGAIPGVPVIHKAVSRLKRELAALSYPEVAAAILSRRGWYRFGGAGAEAEV